MQFMIDSLNPAPENLAYLAIPRNTETRDKDDSAEIRKAERPEESAEFKPFGEEGFLGTLLDIINPLQHIPVVSTLYRSMSGDEISPFSRIVGGALFGGPVGIAASAIDVLIKEDSGKDMGEHAMAALGFGSDEKPADEAPKAVAELAKPIEKPVENKEVPAEEPPPARENPPAAISRSAAQPLSASIPATTSGPDFIPFNEAPKAPPPVSPLAESAQTQMQQAQAQPLYPMAAKEARFMPVDQNRPNGVAPGSNRPAPTRESRAFPVHSGPANGNTRERVMNLPSNDPKIIAATQGQGAIGSHPMLNPAGSQDPAFISQAMMNALDKYQKSSNLGKEKINNDPPS